MIPEKGIIKIKDPQHCADVQEYLFSLGYRWASGDKSLLYLSASKMIIIRENTIRKNDSIIAWEGYIEDGFIEFFYEKDTNLGVEPYYEVY